MIRAVASLAAALALASPLAAQTIDLSRGQDPGLDYAALVAYGPWDDRNYGLVQADLALLAPNEAELNVKIPAFYRVELRRERPEMLREGHVQYPHSAYPMFLTRYSGFLVDGRLYRSLVRGADGRWAVDLTRPYVETGAEATASQALEGDVRVTSPNGGAESAVAIHPRDRDRVIAGSNGPGSGQKMHYSSDGGETWTQVTLPLGGTCCDPTVGWSSDGAFAYTATLGSAVWFYRSGDGGETWTDLEDVTPGDPRRELGSGVDKEYLHVDTFPGSPFRERIYLSWHQANVLRIARSADFGHSWTTLIHSNVSDLRGIGSDIATDRSGNVYHVWPAFNSQKIWALKSTDGGASFGAAVEIAETEGSFIFPVPSIETREVFIYCAADADRTNGEFADSIYVSWTDSTAATTNTAANNHARIQVAYSRDGGATWTVRTPHATGDAATVDRYHPFLAVASDGAVHVVFYDTTDSGGTRNSVKLFHAVSTDGGDSWSTPVALSTASSPDPTDGFEFGDYNGADIAGGRLVAVYTDNRLESGSGNSIDIYAAGGTVTDLIFADAFEVGDLASWEP